MKDNYPTKPNYVCREHLHICYERLRLLVNELGLQKEKSGKVKVKLYNRPKKKNQYEDEISKGYCLNCLFYLNGGVCGKTGKEVGALWKKKCFNGEV